MRLFCRDESCFNGLNFITIVMDQVCISVKYNNLVERVQSQLLFADESTNISDHYDYVAIGIV